MSNHFTSNCSPLAAEVAAYLAVVDDGASTTIAPGPDARVRGITWITGAADTAPTVITVGGDISFRVGATSVAVNDELTVEAGGTGRLVKNDGVAGRWIVGVCTRAADAGGLGVMRLTGVASAGSSSGTPEWTLPTGEALEFGYQSSGEAALMLSGGAEFAVGTPWAASETCLGEGDSIVDYLVAYTETAGVFADVSTAIRAGTGVTLGAAVGDALYLAVDDTAKAVADVYHALGHKIETLVAASGGAIRCEHWTGSAWEHIQTMAVSSGVPYTPYADTPLYRAQSEHVRHNLEESESAAKSDPITPAHGAALYWVRYIVTSALTTPPQIGQVKWHVNRLEVNGDGTIEMFARAMVRDDLGLSIGDFSRGSSAAGSVDIDVSTNIVVGRNYNDFPNGANRSIADMRTMPSWAMTACPLKFELEVRMTGPGTDTDDVMLRLYAAVRKAGAIIAGSEVLAAEEFFTPDGTAGKRITVEISADISSVIPEHRNGTGNYSGDQVALALWRMGSLESPANGDDMEVMSLSATAVRWRFGHPVI